MLITASATKTDGQLMTLCHNWDGQPCYRCVFPKPPLPENVQSCSESGILGPAVGVMGTLMAVEAIKHITQFGAYDTGGGFQWGSLPALTPTLLLYSAFEKVPFRTTYLMKQRKDCALCSSNPSVTRESLQSGSMDYEIFCGLRAPVSILPDHRRISAQAFNDEVKSCSQPLISDSQQSPRHFSSGKSYVLVDVRERQDYEMCHIADSLNVPFSLFEKAQRDAEKNRDESCDDGEVDTMLEELKERIMVRTPDVAKYFICRYGNDSQMAVRYFLDLDPSVPEIRDIEGGLRAWSKVDPTFPEY